MNKNLRLKIEESISTGQISENLLFVCLACLNEKISFAKNNTSFYENQRGMIAKVALDNHIDKETISNKILTISQNDYPTFKAITRLINVLKDDNYIFVSGFIPDKMIHYKSDEELRADMSRKPTQKKKVQIDEKFKNICELIKEDYCIDLDNGMKKALQKLRTSQYTYSVILQTFRLYKKDILKAIQEKHFESSYAKFHYIIGIVKNKLPDTISYLQNKKSANEKLEAMDFSHLAHAGATYKRKTEDTPDWVTEDMW